MREHGEAQPGLQVESTDGTDLGAAEDPGVRSLPAAMVARLRDPALVEREGAAARTHVLAHHGLDAWGDYMLAVYNGLLGTSGRPRW
ncbi:hypothetical protein GCM10023203_10400 [Actinomycetospora straminea]|uniref:Glycosyl transferase family 1 n=1 Tax=Actinomycetospora straminea TaxID=663607 RepID=A0ABP9E067_9PSEU